MNKLRFLGFVAAFAALISSGCASLGGLAGLGIQPLRFATEDARPAEIRLAGLSGAVVRLYARVENPNPVALTLVNLAGTLALEGVQAAQVDFPLGLPLQARGQTTFPIDIRINFADVPRLGGVVTRALSGNSIGYRLDGRFGVDAGLLGQPTFGPTRLLEGSLRPVR